MTPEVTARVFQPFFTTKMRGKGTGLGLATVFAIAQEAGGSVFVESALGQGTRFELILPASDEAAEPPAPVLKALARVGRFGRVALLVEDEYGVRKVAGRILRAAGFRVLEARDGLEGVDIAARTPQLDVIVTDIVMPLVGGPEMVARIRSQWPHIPVLYMSGATDPALLLLDVGLPPLRKPFTERDLIARIEEVVSAVAVGEGRPTLPPSWPRLALR